MTLTHVLGSTWAIEGQQLMGLYKLDRQHCILIDSGRLPEREELAQLLAREGLTPVGVLSTHLHLDHSINNGWLRACYGTQTAAPAAELPLIRSAAALKAYIYCCSPAVLERHLSEMISPVDCPIPEREGSFSFCGANFHIIPTPGHSPGHLSVITPDGVCCVGDAVLSEPLLSQAKLPYNFHIAGMMDSARRLGQLRCPRYLLSHHGVYDDLLPLIEGTCQLSRQRGELICALVTRPMTYGQLWQAVIDHMDLYTAQPFKAALVERNLRSFLDWLVDEGRLHWYAQRGMLYYAPATAP